MNSSRFVSAVLLVFAVLAAPLLAQEEPAQPERLTGDKKVYVPFEKLKDVFEKEGQGVFVPYEEFLRLWKANLDRRPVPKDPPVPFIVTRATYDGVVEGDLAVVRAEIEFETFTPGWSAVPLGFSGVALGGATLGGEPASLEPVKGGFRVLVPEAKAYRLVLDFVTTVAKTEDRRTIAFRMPPTPVSRVSFEIPEEGARVTVEPNLATTRTEPGSGITKVMAYVGAADALKITWQPRPPEVEKGPALVFADTIQTVAVQETVLRIRADVTLRIHRAPVEELILDLDPPANVLFVEGEDLRKWEIAEDDSLRVHLMKPAEESYKLAVTMEVPRPDGDPVRMPSIQVRGAAREQGFVLVRGPETVKVLVESAGLYRTAFETVPKPQRTGDLVYAYRYPAHPFGLTLRVTRIEPVVDVSQRATIGLDGLRLTLEESLNFNVTRVGIFEVRIEAPEGFEITDVSRDAVEDWRLKDGILTLELKGRRIGAFGVVIRASRAAVVGEDPLDLPLPSFKPLGVRRTEGIVGVVRDPALKVEAREVAGYIPLGAGAGGAAAALAYRFRQAERSAVLHVSRRDPEVTAMVITELRTEQNRIAVRSLIRFAILYAGVDEFSFTLPAELREEVRVTGKDIREQPKEDVEAEEGEEAEEDQEARFRQRIVLQGKVEGFYEVAVEYNLPYEGLAVGDSRTIPVPELVVEGVAREQGFYAVYRDPALQIESDSTNLEAADARELPPGVERKDVFLAFKYLVHPHRLSLKVSKHEFLDVLTAVVHHLHLVTILGEEGDVRTEAILAVTNNGLQFLSLTLPPETTPEELWIGTLKGRGKATWSRETLQTEGGGKLLVRMPAGIGPDRRFLVKLVFVRKGEVPGWIFHDFALEAPVIQGGDVPVLGTSWFLYPPADVKLTRVGGRLNWLDRQQSWWSAVLRSLPEIFNRPRRLGSPVVSRVFLPTTISNFAPKGGTPLTFGGRSRAPSVELAYASPGGFNFVKTLVLILVLGGGILLLRGARKRTRFAYTATAVVFPLLIIPVAAMGMAEVLSAALVGGVLVGVYWLVRGAIGAFGKEERP